MMGLATLLGRHARGFFIPYRYADTVRPSGYPALETRLAAAWPAFESILDDLDARASRLRAVGGA
ncbi:MAG: class I SAM-dependent methyltransferase, partial [Geminicoccaceae bacterium]